MYVVKGDILVELLWSVVMAVEEKEEGRDGCV